MSAIAERVDQRVEQRRLALERANETRAAMVAVKHELARGRLTFAAALVDDRAGAMTVYALLCAQRRWGRSRTLKTLNRCVISEGKKVRSLTDRQRRLLVDVAADG